MRIVLLGSTGFVGKAILRQLDKLEDPNLQVKALVRRDVQSSYPFLQLVKGDLSNIPPELWFEKPYVLIHFATKQVDYDATGFEDTNVKGTQRVVDSIKGPCLGVVYGSSMSVYGNGPHSFVNEKAPLAPVTALAKSRAKAEQIVIRSMENLNRCAFCLRPRFIIGEGDRFTMKAWIKLAQKGIRIGSGKQRFNLIDVDDYANIVIDLCQIIFSEQKPTQVALNIGYQEPISYNEIIGMVSGEMRLKWPRKTIPYNRGIMKLISSLPFRFAERLSTQLNLIGEEHTGSVERLFQIVNKKKYQHDPKYLIKRALLYN